MQFKSKEIKYSMVLRIFFLLIFQPGKHNAKDTKSSTSAVLGRERDERGTETAGRESKRVQHKPQTGRRVAMICTKAMVRKYQQYAQKVLKG